MVQELGCHHCTDGVAPTVGLVGTTGAIAKPPGQRIDTAFLESTTDDIDISHGRSLGTACGSSGGDESLDGVDRSFGRLLRHGAQLEAHTELNGGYRDQPGTAGRLADLRDHR